MHSFDPNMSYLSGISISSSPGALSPSGNLALVLSTIITNKLIFRSPVFSPKFRLQGGQALTDEDYEDISISVSPEEPTKVTERYISTVHASSHQLPITRRGLCLSSIPRCRPTPTWTSPGNSTSCSSRRISSRARPDPHPPVQPPRGSACSRGIPTESSPCWLATRPSTAVSARLLP